MQTHVHQNGTDNLKDLGFGSRVTGESRFRLLNRDGSFNVGRSGLSFLESIHFYHSFLNMSWWRFHLTILAFFLLINVVFACLFLLAGPGAIQGLTGQTTLETFLQAFYLSVHTFTTVGYGTLAPAGTAANLIATLDAYIGLLSFALATGILFARFSRPSARLVFSRKAVIAPYREGSAFEFRMANMRRSQLVDLELKVFFTSRSGGEPKRARSFQELELERSKVAFLPLHLTVVHSIGPKSPMHGLNQQDLEKAEAEFLVVVSAFDETFSQTVHARSSYKSDEILWGAKFTDIFQYSRGGLVGIDLRCLHDTEEAALPSQNS